MNPIRFIRFSTISGLSISFSLVSTMVGLQCYASQKNSWTSLEPSSAHLCSSKKQAIFSSVPIFYRKLCNFLTSKPSEATAVCYNLQFLKHLCRKSGFYEVKLPRNAFGCFLNQFSWNSWVSYTDFILRLFSSVSPRHYSWSFGLSIPPDIMVLG